MHFYRHVIKPTIFIWGLSVYFKQWSDPDVIMLNFKCSSRPMTQKQDSCQSTSICLRGLSYFLAHWSPTNCVQSSIPPQQQYWCMIGSNIVNRDTYYSAVQVSIPCSSKKCVGESGNKVAATEWPVYYWAEADKNQYRWLHLNMQGNIRGLYKYVHDYHYTKLICCPLGSCIPSPLLQYKQTCGL